MRNKFSPWRRPCPDAVSGIRPLGAWPGPASHGGLAALALAACLITAPAILAQDYEAGRAAYVAGDYEQAFQILEPLAEDGHSEAQKLLGVMYDYGHGVKTDPKQALEWYIKSAEQGDPAVQYQVGAKYFRGDGVARSFTEAARWWELAANGGQVDAQFNLGLMYFRGLAVRQNDARSAELFRLAAEQGHGHSQYSLAVMYAFGRGVEKNYDTALTWFNKSASQGVPQAQFNLGVFYENGYGVAKDPAAARQWYQRAAAQGLAEAAAKIAAPAAPAESPTGIRHPDDLAAAALPAGSPEAASRAEPEPVISGAPAPQSTRVYPPPATQSRIEPETIPEVEQSVAAAMPEPAAEAPGIPVYPPPEGDSSPRREQWVMSQNPENYTLQIGSVTSEKDMQKFLRQTGVEQRTAYIQVEIDGVTRYNALYGVYASYEEAQQAAEGLPPTLRQVKPWVRNFRVLQAMVK